MNTTLTKAIKEDSFFCNHFLNIQIDFLVKLFNKTESPIVGKYIVGLLEKIKKYRFWEIIRPIIVDKYLNFWSIKFNYISKLYKDEKRKVIYLPLYYPRDDITYFFKNYKDEDLYIKIHLDRIKIFFTYNYNKLFKNYLTNRNKKYERKRENALKYLKSEDTILLTFPIVKKSRVSKVITKNINKKIVQHYYKRNIYIASLIPLK